jgi:hypothetical protein
MNDELDYSDAAALALEEECTEAAQDLDPYFAMEGLSEEMAECEEEDLFDIIERGSWG